MEKILWIMAAGALGSLARYGVVTYVQRQSGSNFPWGVLTVNMIGSFVFGLIWSISEQRDWIGENMRVVMLAGFIGAFTTFSTFAFDSMQMVRTANWHFLVWHLIIPNIFGIALAFAGFRLGRAV